ncbi:MAG: hypothetical protein ACI363_06405 [Phocaeicola plebeius]
MKVSACAHEGTFDDQRRYLHRAMKVSAKKQQEKHVKQYEEFFLVSVRPPAIKFCETFGKVRIIPYF